MELPNRTLEARDPELNLAATAQAFLKRIAPCQSPTLLPTLVHISATVLTLRLGFPQLMDETLIGRAPRREALRDSFC